MHSILTKTKSAFLTLSLSFLIFSTDSFGQDSVDTLLERGLYAFYHADWIEADSLFIEASIAAQGDPRGVFFASMIPFWSYFFVEPDPELASDYFSKSSLAIELSNQQLEVNPDDSTMVLLLSGLHGYRSLMAAREKRYAQAVKNGVTGFGYTTQLLRYGNDRADVRIGQGMYYYMVGSIPSEIRWMFTLFRENGSVERGLEELRLAASDSSYIGDEAKMILAYLYKKEKRYEEAIEFLDRLIDEYPNNPIFLFLKANNLQALGKDELASELYYQVSDLENPSFARLRERSLEQLSVSR